MDENKKKTGRPKKLQEKKKVNRLVNRKVGVMCKHRSEVRRCHKHEKGANDISKNRNKITDGRSTRTSRREY